jgi:hypothetical protein
MFAIGSGFFEPINIPQDIITGIVATFIGLVILFSIKPRLVIELVQPSPTRSPSEGTCRATFVVTNKSAMQVIEVEARLFRVDVSVSPPTRAPVHLRTSELFQLSGWATPSQRRSVIQGPKGKFSFVTRDPLDPAQFKEWRNLVGPAGKTETLKSEYLLFQVRAKRGFTNFGRTAIRRWIVEDNQFVPWQTKEDPFADITCAVQDR